MSLKRRGIISKLGPAQEMPTQTMLPFAPRIRQPRFAGGREGRKVYGQIGGLEVRMAASRSEIKRAQELRYDVFYKELSAIPDALSAKARRDEDPFDAICDHLLVVDKSVPHKQRRPWPRKQRVVGTYRLLRQEIAEANDGFYSQGEYDIAPLLARHGGEHRFLEVGRSCVLAPYRNKRSVELLWQGVWTYAREHGCDVMLGCASLEGTDPDQHAAALSFLHHHARAPEKWRVRAHEHVHVDMNFMPASQLDSRAALRALPPLIKGYLRLGAYVGDGAVIDRQFGTTDVFIILPVEAIDKRYFAHFGAPEEIKAGAAKTKRYN